MQQIEIEINLSEWQREVFRRRNDYRFTVISAGRQSGKTFLCVTLNILYLIQNPNKTCWWVAPTFTPAKIAFRRMLTAINLYKIGHSVNKSELRIVLANGCAVEFKSAEREEGLRAESVNFMVVDEMGLIKRDAWQYAMRGTITATEAPVIFIGTPKGKNLFYELFLQGQDRTEKDSISYQFSSRMSPFFSEAEWRRVQNLPERIFRQEYLAEFLDDGGEVFRNIRNCIKGKLEEPHPGRAYYAGIDLAKSVDYTVIIILNAQGHVCAFERFNEIAWSVQKRRIIDICTRYGAIALIDSTGIGDPILDDLQRSSVKISGFNFTNTSKRHLIETLSMSIEREDISYPEIPELINELNIFTFEQTQSGLIRYSAPSGLHDDIVIALALANKLYVESSGRGMIEAYDRENYYEN